MTRILVVFGSKRGGTAGLAAMIGNALTEDGCQVAVSPARQIHDLAGFDAVIVAGALYANRWHRDARRFVRRNAAALGKLPVWLVSTGPLDDTATQRDIEPTRQVQKLITKVGARGHATFGGRLSPDAKGFPASAMRRTRLATGEMPHTCTGGSLRSSSNSPPGKLPVAPSRVAEGAHCPVAIIRDDDERQRSDRRWIAVAVKASTEDEDIVVTVMEKALSR